MFDKKSVRRSFGLCVCSLALLTAVSVAYAHAPLSTPAPKVCEHVITTDAGSTVAFWDCPYYWCECGSFTVVFNSQGEIVGGSGTCDCTI